MPEFFLPTERDKQLIQLVVDTVTNRLINNFGFTQSNDVEDDIQSPDVYIALPPSGGIPALSRAGTADVPGEGDSPGSAICPIYQVLNDGTLEPISGFAQIVYNLFTSAVSREWITVQRTKFGIWIVSEEDVNVKIKEGVLAGPLLPATNALTLPTTASLTVYAEPSAGTGGFEVTGETIIVVNRFTQIQTISTGTWVVVKRIGSEWRPISADCGITVLV